jgi:hypothetical protein
MGNEYPAGAAEEKENPYRKEALEPVRKEDRHRSNKGSEQERRPNEAFPEVEAD